MTSKALDCSSCGSVFHAPRSIFKNRKMLAAVACVNNTDKWRFASALGSKIRSLL
jgi:hypothetical protein